ncbi:hypothetical protein HDU81_002298 [Chytriomyces hyalinus]|nr:hypothetical protein HDU81_002298 [Chytriomyces hyalinus]
MNPTPSTANISTTLAPEQSNSQPPFSNERKIIRRRTIIVQRTAPAPLVQPTVALPLKRKRGGENDLAEREMVKDLRGAANVRKICEILAGAPSDSDLTNGARSFVNQCRPIVGCLQHHFSGDVDEFVQHYSNIATSSFKTAKCQGKSGIPCGQF